MTFADMFCVSEKLIEPVQNERKCVIIARRTFRLFDNVCNSFSIISFVWYKRSREFTMCFPTLPALKNSELISICVSGRIDRFSVACPSGEQFSATHWAGNNLQSDNYYESPIVFFTKC